MHIEHYVPMRLKTGDCAIAALATATGISYETAAATLGVQLGASGEPDMALWPWPSDQEGLATLADMRDRMNAAGMAATLMADVFSLTIFRLAVPISAVLFADTGHPDDAGKTHALAYRAGDIIDCRHQQPTPPGADLSILAALALLPNEPV